MTSSIRKSIEDIKIFEKRSLRVSRVSYSIEWNPSPLLYLLSCSLIKEWFSHLDTLIRTNQIKWVRKIMDLKGHVRIAIPKVHLFFFLFTFIRLNLKWPQKRIRHTRISLSIFMVSGEFFVSKMISLNLICQRDVYTRMWTYQMVRFSTKLRNKKIQLHFHFFKVASENEKK